MTLANTIETLAVVEKRYIKHVLDSCNGNIAHAAKLLGIGRTTLYRRVKKYSKQPSDTPTSLHVPCSKPNNTKYPLLPDRRKVERAIERCGGILKHAAKHLTISYPCLLYNLATWSKHNEDHINFKAPQEGISKEEIDVIFKRMSVTEYAKLCDCSPVTAYKLIDEAIDILGLRRYKQWLFLKI